MRLQDCAIAREKIVFAGPWEPSDFAKLPDGRILRLIDDAVLLRLEKPERWHAKFRLWIPDNAKREAYELYVGTVIACGPGRRHAKRGTLIPMELKPGDRVQFYFAAGEIDFTAMYGESGVEYRVISEKSVQCVISND